MPETVPSGAPKHETERHVLRLEGCRPTPLGTYLKALGVLRLVSEQADAEARGWWKDETFMLETSLGEDGVREFFLERYAPTPILAPWNGGSGFYPKDNTGAIDAIVQGRAERLQRLKSAIEQVRTLLRDEHLDERPDADRKERLLLRVRAEADDSLLPWIDAAVMLTGEGPKYPPLLGTGGNDGRLDFTNNLMARITDVMDVDTGRSAESSPAQLGDALFASPIAGLASAAIGQFAPGAAGGPNASTGFSGGALVNPWNFVLMMEGAVLFAAAASRRLEGIGDGDLAYPFTVRTTGSGSGNTSLSDEGSARAETWMPLWERPALLLEIRAILGEGRVVVSGRKARDGLDFARAVAKLGVDRGIVGFQRYAYLMRAGRAYLATPLNRIRVRRNPAVDLIDDLDQRNWLRRFRTLGRGRDAPARLASLARQLENALFALAGEATRTPASVQGVLVVLGKAQRYLATSPKAMDACPPVPVLGWKWARAANDGSAEFLVAAALAGLHARRRDSGEPLLPMAAHMAPLALERSRTRSWNPEAHHQAVWGGGGLDENLGRIMMRRLLEAGEANLDDIPLHATAVAPLSAVATWLAGGLLDRRISELLLGLSLTRIPEGLRRRLESPWPPPAAFTLLKPLFTTQAQLLRTKVLSDDVTLPSPHEVVRLLMADRADHAVELGWRRLRARGIAVPDTTIRTCGLSGPRLLSALMVPLSDSDSERLARRLFDRRDENNTDLPQPPPED